MEKQEVVDIIQQKIDSEFDKFLEVDLNNRKVQIAITKDHTPTVKGVEVCKNNLVIKFTDNVLLKNDYQEVELLEDKQGQLVAIIIPNINFLSKKHYRPKSVKYISEYIQSLPEKNKQYVLHMNRQKRISHALTEILKTLPNILQDVSKDLNKLIH